MFAKEHLARMEAQSIGREQSLRANGIPVSEWGRDETLIRYYAAEMLAVHMVDAEERNGRA